MRRQGRWISYYLICFILIETILAGEFCSAQTVEQRDRCNQRLEALSLALKLTPIQMKEATVIIKADESSKETLRVQFRRRYEYLQRIVRRKGTSDSQIRSGCRAIAETQEQLIYQDAKTQVALRGLLNTQQMEVFNQMALTKDGSSGFRPRRASKSESPGRSCSPRKAPSHAP